jgi:arsenate reductase (thioredoxin)
MEKCLLTMLLALSIETGYGQTKKVVFVCEHGAAKSVIAANYFNQLAAERGLEFEAVCRATAPDSTLGSATRAGLKTDNIPQNLNPQKISFLDTVNVERIILFIPLPTDYETEVLIEDWSGVQNVDGSYTQRREAIIQKVKTLLDSLEKRKLK